MSIDALVFDFDGLILDTEWSEYVTVRDVFVAHGVDLALDDWRGRVGRSDNPHWSEWLEREVGRPVDREALRVERLEAHHALIRREQVMPGVEALLDQADAAGVPTAVASSSSEDWVTSHLERLALLERFAVLRCGNHVALGKPAPDLYLAVASALGADPARSVALEDSHHGSVAAAEAGFYCVVVPNRVTRVPRFPRADLVVDSLAELDLPGLAAGIAARHGDSSAAAVEP